MKRAAVLVTIAMFAVMPREAYGASVVGTWWCEVPGPQGTEYQVVNFRSNGTYSVNSEVPGVARGQIAGQWSGQGNTIFMTAYGQVCTAYGCSPVSTSYPLTIAFGNNGAVMWTSYGTCVSPWATFEDVLADHHPHPHSKMRLWEETPKLEGETRGASKFFREWGAVLKRLRP